VAPGTAFADSKSQVASAQGDTNGPAALVSAQTPHGVPGNCQVFLTACTDGPNIRADLR
jgi:hypothetical protein